MCSTPVNCLRYSSEAKKKLVQKMTAKIKHKRFKKKCKLNFALDSFLLRWFGSWRCHDQVERQQIKIYSTLSILMLLIWFSLSGLVNKSKPRRTRYAYPMPTRKGLLAPQNTFLDTIATRFDGTRKFYCSHHSRTFVFCVVVLTRICLRDDKETRSNYAEKTSLTFLYHLFRCAREDLWDDFK